MINRVSFQRTHALTLNVEKLIRPTHCEDGHLHGFLWHAELGREVPIRVAVPRGMDPDDAMAGAASGFLVLDKSGRRLTRSWG